MITGAHTVLYADDAEAARTFLADVLGLAHVDAGDGWLIFALPPSELGVHPVEPGTPQGGRHELFLLCDDIERTVEDLRAQGVEFAGGISDEGWGLVTTLIVPGGLTLGLYEPRHATAGGSA